MAYIWPYRVIYGQIWPKWPNMAKMVILVIFGEISDYEGYLEMTKVVILVKYAYACVYMRIHVYIRPVYIGD